MTPKPDSHELKIEQDHGDMTSRARRLLPPGLLVLALAVSEELWPLILRATRLDAGGEADIVLRTGLDILFWLGIGLLVSRILTLFVWEGVIRHKTGHPVPRLLEDLTSGLVWLITFGIVAGTVFDLPIAGLVTTSGVAIAIVGFALRGMISDIFTGIAIGLERPLKPGDWIEIESGATGRVIDMNWRATRILTLDEVAIVIPNSHLGIQPFRNYSIPHRYFRTSMEFVLDYRVPAAQAERVLLSSVREIPELRSIPRKPDVIATAFTERGITWEMRFWVPDVPDQRPITNQVLRNVQRNLNHAGLDIPAERIELTRPSHIAAWDDEEGAKRQFVTGIGLFAALSDDNITRIVDRVDHRFCEAGEAVVAQGDPGQSLYIVKEGMLNVVIGDENGTESLVGQLSAGSFFGEMSLLTGSSRAATVISTVDSVVYEITKDVIEPLLHERPELVEALSQTLAERQIANLVKRDRSDSETEHETESLSRHLFGRISLFFHIGH